MELQRPLGAIENILKMASCPEKRSSNKFTSDTLKDQQQLLLGRLMLAPFMLALRLKRTGRPVCFVVAGWFVSQKVRVGNDLRRSTAGHPRFCLPFKTFLHAQEIGPRTAFRTGRGIDVRAWTKKRVDPVK